MTNKMRRLNTFVVVLTTLLCSLTINAWGETLTVADGSETTNAVPVTGLYCNWTGTRTQTIYPASLLTELTEKDITALTFYSSETSVSYSGVVLAVRMAEVESTTLSGFLSPTFITVYTGSIAISDGEMQFPLIDPVPYYGGSLLIETEVITEGDNNYPHFYCVSADGAGYGNRTSLIGRANVVDYRPKTTFAYQDRGACASPYDMAAEPVTSYRAALTWKRKGLETAWDIAYSDDNFATSTVQHVTTSDVVVSGDVCSCTISGLTALTTYKVKVRTNCGESESAYSSAYSFTTVKPEVRSFPWSVNFEDETVESTPTYWDISGSASSTLPVNPEYVWGVYAYQGNKMIRMFNDSVHSGSALINTPVIELPASPEMDMTFKYTHNAPCGAFYVKVSTDGGESFSAIGTFDGAEGDKYNPGTFTDAVVDLSEYAGQSVILQFYANADYMGGAIFVDNVSVESRPLCSAPTAVTVSEKTATGCLVSWTAGSDETSWNLQYVAKNSNEWVVVENITTNSYVITELLPGTTYEVHVQAICSGDNGTSRWTSVVEFDTECGAIPNADLPWKYDFEEDEAGDAVIPRCWSSKTYIGEYPRIAESKEAHTGNKCLEFHGGNYWSEQCVILPEFEDDLKDLTLWFYYKNGNLLVEHPTFEVGYFSKDGDPNSTFNVIEELPLSSSYTLAKVDLKDMPTTHKRVVINYANGRGIISIEAYIDDITVKPTAHIFTDAEKDGSWSNTANWDEGTLPTIDDDVIISQPITIDAAHAEAKSIVLDQRRHRTGQLIIEPNKGLVVAETIKVNDGTGLVATTAADIVLESSAAGNATLIFDNDGNEATVQLYSKASIGEHWNWQYIGTPLADGNALSDYYGSYLYKWNGGWQSVQNGAAMEPFAGYCITQADATTHTMGGTLVPTTSKTFTLGTNEDLVIANSWTAPIYIGAFTEKTFTSTPATIYLFNTGHAENGATEGTEAGTYETIPVNSAPYTGNELIAPMQGFFVTSYGGSPGTITLNYDDLVRPADDRSIIAGAMHAPQRGQAPQVLKITAAGSRYSDRLVLLTREDFSFGFDNGWDGEKLTFGDASPSLYTISETGMYEAVSAVPELEGVVVGFHAGEDAMCTLSFEYDGCETLYLNDFLEQQSTLIDDQNTYTFFSAGDRDATRFVISRTPIKRIATALDNAQLPQTANRKIVINNRLYVIHGGQMFSAEGVKIQ